MSHDLVVMAISPYLAVALGAAACTSLQISRFMHRQAVFNEAGPELIPSTRTYQLQVVAFLTWGPAGSSTFPSLPDFKPPASHDLLWIDALVPYFLGPCSWDRASLRGGSGGY